MQGVNCVKGEIHNVLTVLRLYQNRELRKNPFATCEDPLIWNLKELRSALANVSDLRLFDTRAYLRPFLAIIISDYTDVQTTAIALQSVHKFLMYGHISQDSPYVAEAIFDITHHATHCRWDGGRQHESEIVHMKILEVLLECLRCDAGELLTDDAVCSMVIECFNVRSRAEISHLLLKYSENILMEMVLVLFSRLNPGTRTGGDTLDPHAPIDPSSLRKPCRSRSSSRKRDKLVKKQGRRLREFESSETEAPSGDEKVDENAVVRRPYGIGALQRVFRFLVNLINPSDEKSDKQGESTKLSKVLGLRLIRTVFETTGKHLGYCAPLVEVVQNELCKFILQNSQTKDIYILSLVLRIVFDMFATVKQHLKVQLEVFFASIHMRIGESPTAPYEHKEMVIESLLDFCREPSLIIGLYRNYDCEVGSTNLFEDLCQFLASSAIPQGPPNTFHVLSFECILSVLESISKRFCVSDDKKEESDDEDECCLTLNKDEEARILEARHEKKKLRQAAEAFNQDGKKAFEFLQSVKLLPESLTPESVVHFFRCTPGLDRGAIGKFLGSAGEFPKLVRNHFVNTFDFKSATANYPVDPEFGLALDIGLRVFLDSFVLAGESQQIGEIIEAFANKFFEYCESANLHGPIADPGSAFVLSYSIIMLNTDAHNKGVKKKMTLEEFVRINRDMNAGKNFPLAYLTSLYNSIQQNEIKMTSDSLKDFGPSNSFSNKKWSMVIGKSKEKGKFETSVPATHGKEMFSLIWESAINVFHFYLFKLEVDIFVSENGTEPRIVQNIRSGFENFGRICALYDMGPAFDTLITLLCNTICAIFEGLPPSENETMSLEIMGRNTRLCVATSILFSLVQEYGPTLLVNGWTNVLQVVLWLHRLWLLPASLSELEDFLDSKGQPLDTLRKGEKEFVSADNDTSLSSAAVSFISSAFGMFWGTQTEELKVIESPVEKNTVNVSEEENFSARAKECVNGFEIAAIFNATKYFQPASLSSLFRALVTFTTFGNKPGEDVPLPEGVSPLLLTEENAVFCLERLVDVLEKNQARMEDASVSLWPIIQEVFRAALTRPVEPTFFLERVVVNLLRLPMRLLLHPEVTCERMVSLHSLLGSLSPNALHVFGTRITAGVLVFLETHAEHITTTEAWDSILGLLVKFKDHTQAANSAFQALVFVVENHVGFVNFGSLRRALLVCAQPAADGAAWQPLSFVIVCDALLKLHSKIQVLNQQVAQLYADTGLQGEALMQRRREVERREKEKNDHWLHSLSGFCGLCVDRRPLVRRKAIECLQSALLSSGVVMKQCRPWKGCFEKLLIPLLEHLAKYPPEKLVAEGRPGSATPTQDGWFDIRDRGQTLVFQTFLHNLDTLATLPDFNVFWLWFVGSMERHMKDKQGVSDHFSESLKNLILVMHSAGTFELASKRSGQDLWALTWAVLNRPEMKEQLTQSLQERVPVSPPPSLAQHLIVTNQVQNQAVPQPELKGESESAGQPKGIGQTEQDSVNDGLPSNGQSILGVPELH